MKIEVKTNLFCKVNVMLKVWLSKFHKSSAFFEEGHSFSQSLYLYHFFRPHIGFSLLFQIGIERNLKKKQETQKTKSLP